MLTLLPNYWSKNVPRRAQVNSNRNKHRDNAHFNGNDSGKSNLWYFVALILDGEAKNQAKNQTGPINPCAIIGHYHREKKYRIWFRNEKK